MAFAYYKTATLDHTQAGSADSSNWPLTIGRGVGPQSADADLKTVGNGGFVQNANGYDIRPYADAGLTSPLTFELVFYDGATGSLEMHVKIPTLSHTSDVVIYLAFGDAGISTDGSSTATWDSDFLSVYHLADGTVLDTSDATGANNGTPVNTPTATTGQIDGGVHLHAASLQYVDLGTAMDPAAMTYSIWVNGDSFSDSYNSTIVRSGGTGSDYSQLFVKSNGKIAVYLGAAGNVDYDGTGSHTLSTGTWYLVAFTYDSTNGLIGYVNGGVDGTAGANGTINTHTAPTYLGHDANGGRFWDGVLDEARISQIARSASWLLSDYNAQKSSSTFITWGAKTPVGATGNPWLLYAQQRRQ